MKFFITKAIRIILEFIYSLDRTILVSLLIGVFSVIALAFWFTSSSNTIQISNNSTDNTKLSPITGLECDSPDTRPLAIMIASDTQARPLSGIADAELVIEMPVTPGGITRMMAVYQCTQPKEIGSIRSARMDFLGVVKGIDAIYAHWGGEHDALESLKTGTLDNIDALRYEGTVFYRKNDVPPPHNGFTTLKLLRKQADKLEYSSSWEGFFWNHRKDRPKRGLGNASSGLTLSYPTGSTIKWTYNSENNLWERERDGSPETDAISGKVVEAGAVIIMETESTFLREQYISVRLTGNGSGILYQDGMRQRINWSKQDNSAMLEFKNKDGQPISLAPGPVWIAIVTPSIKIK